MIQRMQLDCFQIDAFTDKVFSGNPACVVPLTRWLDDDTLLKIARENAVAETAFFISTADGFHLRWFTPEIEMDLCGHATLATAYCLKTQLSYPSNRLTFLTKSGILTVDYQKDTYHLCFPSRPAKSAKLPQNIAKSLSIPPKMTFKARDYMLVYECEEDIKHIQIIRQHFDQINLDPGGVVITAPGNDCDFVSRFFTPQASIFEDPVTGSAHCTLIPYWAQRLQKNQLTAKQLSEREGQLTCEDCGENVIISGKAQLYSKATIYLPTIVMDYDAITQ